MATKTPPPARPERRKLLPPLPKPGGSVIVTFEQWGEWKEKHGIVKVELGTWRGGPVPVIAHTEDQTHT
jgi:hypothetical protein